jgi:hypothetical protein
MEAPFPPYIFESIEAVEKNSMLFSSRDEVEVDLALGHLLEVAKNRIFVEVAKPAGQSWCLVRILRSLLYFMHQLSSSPDQSQLDLRPLKTVGHS